MAADVDERFFVEKEKVDAVSSAELIQVFLAFDGQCVIQFGKAPLRSPLHICHETFIQFV